jgi:hypothetical protein
VKPLLAIPLPLSGVRLGGFVMKARTWLALLMLSVGTVFATASCGSDEATGSGAGGDAGEGSLITGGGGGKGGAGAVGRAGASSNNAGGESGATAVGSGALGTTCSADIPCGAGLTCLTPDSTKLDGSGPSNGLCTLTCTTDADCSSAEAGAGCVVFGDNGYCVESCEQGEPADLDTKCQGRPDETCAALSDGSTFCVPLCRSDVECGAGFYCNPGSGLCSSTKPTGKPVGTPCDPTAATDICEGICIASSDTVPTAGVCVEFCSGELPCMYSGTTPGGLCIGPLSDTFGSFDLGYCLPNCACDSDCKFPGDVCRAWSTNTTEQQLKTTLGADGLCYPNTLDSVELDCGAGGASNGAGGASGAGN